VLVHDRLDPSHAMALHELRGRWEAPSGQADRLAIDGARLAVDLELPPDLVAPLPPGSAIDEDLFELAGVIAHRIGDGWSSCVARVWGGWQSTSASTTG